jgi:hypothetical protein
MQYSANTTTTGTPARKLRKVDCCKGKKGGDQGPRPFLALEQRLVGGDGFEAVAVGA